MIEVGLYRSGPIHPVHFPFINGLGLRTVLVLSVDGMPTRAASTFLEESGVDVVPLAQSSSAVTHSRGGMQDVGNGVGRNGHGQLCLRPLEERVKLALELMLDRRNHPLLITCTNGMQETGVVTACLRKLLGWNLTAIFAEYRNFAGSKSRMVHEQAVELFDLVCYLEVAV